ncbi:PREDICTED: uncharacterized protein LOC108579130 [Habropoda laboriosa]|uniref:uncharacterized protein LOC108579130 n=1 Tax=Habropoda laboriosa TaxID=597456 RepID=UPI00083E10AA|nr:PREDICTED: uncharacterized protein LOC108579130 [Habropoda laboriosa]
MEMYEVIKNNLDNVKDSEKSEESIDEQKSRLKKQIDQLKSIILEIEWNLNILKFGKIECTFHPDTTDGLTIDNIPDVDIQLGSQLYRYAGLYCVKFSKEKYVFHFSCSNKYAKEDIFAVEILNNQDQGTLGKWLMPMAIDLEYLVSEVPIDNLKNVPHFLRTCKHYIDCYYIRHEQYTTLMDNISDITNCIVQTNLGHTQINLELMRVHDENTDCYMNTIIYLLYNTNEARPHQITVDLVNDDDEPNNSIKTQLQKSLVCFKMFDLHIAFEKMLKKKPYTWSRESGEDNPLGIGTPSGSDEEGFLEKFSFQIEKSFSPGATKRRKRKRHKETTRVGKHSNLSSQSNSNEKSITFQNKNEKFKNLYEQSTSQQNVDVKRSELKQTKLRFELTDSKVQSSSNTVVTPLKNKEIIEQLHKPCTSTPLHHDEPCSSNLRPSNIDISDITVSGSNLDNTKIKKHIDAATKNSLEVENQYRNGTPVKKIIKCLNGSASANNNVE